MGSMIHEEQESTRDTLCRTTEREAFLTIDLGIVTCPACQSIRAQQERVREYGYKVVDKGWIDD